jgi:hypothetical protein
MNHLCGLSKLDGGKINRLADEERAVFDAFRRRYESALRGDDEAGRTTSYDDDHADQHNIEEKKDAISTTTATPSLPPLVYVVPHDELAPSGLRPLDDVTLYRYLLADRRTDGTYDPDESFRRLLSALEFRKRVRCDDIVRRLQLHWHDSVDKDDVAIPPPVVRKCQRLRVGIWAGTDRAHRPVVFERLGQFLSSGNVSKVDRDDWTMSYLYFLETHFAKMRESASSSGVVVDRITYFADLQGVYGSIINGRIWKVVPLLKALARTVECHYPELVDHITLFNVPRAASAVYAVIRGFLDPVTAGKIELHPGVPHGRFAELLPEDVIPVEYGGRNDVDYPQTASE